VEPSAIDLERLCQRAEPMVRREIGRGRLQIANTLDEYLQIMNATQEILRSSQGPNRSRHPLMSRLRQELRRVPEFLHRDADVMEAFGDIHGTGDLHRGSHACRAMCHTRLQRPQPRMTRPTAGSPMPFPVVRFQMLYDTLKFRDDSFQSLGREFRSEAFARGDSRLLDISPNCFNAIDEYAWSRLSSWITSIKTSSWRTLPSRLVTLPSC
jgi:hypothetical protein